MTPAITPELRERAGSYYALVLCRKAEPGKQWVAPLHLDKRSIIRSQGAVLCRPQYADIRPLYRLHIRFKPAPPASPLATGEAENPNQQTRLSALGARHHGGR